MSFKINGEIKSFTDKQKLRKFSTTKPALQQILKGVTYPVNTRERKDLQKQTQINQENANSNICINNYLKCKWIKWTNQKIQTDSVQFSRSVVSDSLWPHELQKARPPCPSPTPGVYPNSCPFSWWCHPTISSSVVPFSSRLQSFSTSGFFQMS